jgi:hypothetical protein
VHDYCDADVELCSYVGSVLGCLANAPWDPEPQPVCQDVAADPGLVIHKRQLIIDAARQLKTAQASKRLTEDITDCTVP